MIDLYYFPTPNGRKITIALEELEIPYAIHLVDILDRQQFNTDFLRISCNNKIPAIVDNRAEGQGLSVFESGAILMYLAETAGKLLPSSGPARVEVLEWLMWQVAGLGPMGGQANHFNYYAREKIPYAIERYTQELNRLYGVMDRRLNAREFLCKQYSIADIACFGWVQQAAVGGVDLAAFPHVSEWFSRMNARPAVQRALAKDKQFDRPTSLTDAQHRNLFGSSASD